MAKLPEQFKSYFWDTDFKKLDTNKNSFLVIKRLLDRGNTADIKWLISQYGENKIKKVVISSKDISRPTATFWGKMLDVPINDIACLQKPYSPIRFGLSS